MDRKFELTGSWSVEDVSQCIRDHGLAVLRDSVDETLLRELAKDFERALSITASSAGVRPISMNAGKGVILDRRSIRDGSFKAAKDFFWCDLHRDVSERYWHRPVDLNAQIYVLNEVVGTEHIAQELHFDVQETFKAFVYLNDIDRDNGAFWCVPGSHHRTREVRSQLGGRIAYENRQLTRAVERDPEAEPIEGPAGTVIFFTTEVLHKAGSVSVGERRIMRGHTRPAGHPKWLQKLSRIFGAGNGRG